MKISGSQVTSPVAMWLHALEALLQRLKVRVPFCPPIGSSNKIDAVRVLAPVSCRLRLSSALMWNQQSDVVVVAAAAAVLA